MKRHKLRQKTAMLTAVSVFALMLGACSQKSSINNNGISVEKLQFSKTHYKQMLRQFSQTLTYQLPDTALLETIDNAPSDSAAKDAYEAGVDTIIDDPTKPMKAFLLDYFFEVLGVGSTLSNDEINMPALLFAWTIMNGDSIEDALLSQDVAYDNDGNQISSDYTNAYPAAERAGYLTMESFIDEWNSQFKFNFAREAYALNLCDVAPFTKLNLYEWPEANMNPKYLTEDGNPIICKTCHVYLATHRYAFRFLAGNGQYNNGITQGQDSWDMEDNGYQGEPLIAGYDPDSLTAGDVMSEEDGKAFYKLTNSGSVMETPQDFAQSVVDHERFDHCWTARAIGMLSNLDFGTAGIGTKVPQDFTSSTQEEKFIATWIEVFRENDKSILELLRHFAKSNDYLILGYAQ